MYLEAGQQWSVDDHHSRQMPIIDQIVSVLIDAHGSLYTTLLPFQFGKSEVHPQCWRDGKEGMVAYRKRIRNHTLEHWRCYWLMARVICLKQLSVCGRSISSVQMNTYRSQVQRDSSRWITIRFRTIILYSYTTPGNVYLNIMLNA